VRAHRPSHPIQLDLPTGLKNPRCSRPIFNPDLGLAAGLHSIARRINGVEKRLFLIEVGAIERISAVERISEHDDPSRFAGLAADLKLHRSHQLNSLAQDLRQDESHPGPVPDPIPIVRVLGQWMGISFHWGDKIAPLDQNLCEVLHTIRRFLESDADKTDLSIEIVAGVDLGGCYGRAFNSGLEATIASAKAWLYLASVQLLIGD